MNARIVIDFRYIVLQYYRKFFRLMKQNIRQSITNVVYNNISINVQNSFPNICALYFALYVSPDSQQYRRWIANQNMYMICRSVYNLQHTVRIFCCIGDSYIYQL